MAIRKIAKMGHPILRKVARPLSTEEIQSESVRQILRDMIETMEEYGGVGLAAPQVHESLQLAIIGFENDNERYEGLGSQDLTVFINPTITVRSPEIQSYWEGCLSVPGLRGFVSRPKKVRVDYLNDLGVEKHLEAEGFLATVIQHELDHLSGKLYLDRMQNMTQLVFNAEYQKYWAKIGDVEEVS